jgi:hypothetical protein
MKITFRCDPVLFDSLERPVPSRQKLPDWLRTMPMQAWSDTHGHAVRTVKQCPPFVDAMAYGFIMTLPCDIRVAGSVLAWDWPHPPLSVAAHPASPLSFHVPAQVTGSPLHHPGRTLVKFNSFWTIALEPGWSLFATHPINRADLPFRLLTGLIDADRFNDIGILFPAEWTDPDFEGVLPRGTPVAQCFAVSRTTPELVFMPFSEADAARYNATASDVLAAPGVYRRRFRARRLRSAAKPMAQAIEIEP